MRISTWSYAVNSLPQFNCGDIILIDDTWWLAFINFVNEHIIGMGCRLFQYIQLPKWWKITVDGEKTDLRSWYGTCGDLWHMCVYLPIFYYYEPTSPT